MIYATEEEAKLEQHFAAKFAEWDKGMLLGPMAEQLGCPGHVGLALVVEVACRSLAVRLSGAPNGAREIAESPIEVLMAYALACAGYYRGGSVFFGIQGRQYGIDSGVDNQFIITPQASIGEYRVDFLLEAKVPVYSWDENHREQVTYYSSSLVVECDGHDFHEKTKQQASKDKKRDRTLQSCGYQVFHFTGSEIWKDPFACAAQVIGNALHAAYAKRPKEASEKTRAKEREEAENEKGSAEAPPKESD